MSFKRLLPLITVVSILPTALLASPTGTQEAVGNECTNQHILAPLSGQSEIEALCSAGQESSLTTSPGLNETQLNTLTGNFSASRFRPQSGNSGLGQSGDPADGYVQHDASTLSGMNAGSTMGTVLGGLTVWSTFNWGTADNTFVNTTWNSDTRNIMVGGHGYLADNVIMGASFGYETTNVESAFNNGTQDIDGFTLAAYGGWFVNDWLSFDVSAGQTHSDIQQQRPVSAFEVAAGTTLGGLGAGTIVTSDVDQERWFVSTNMNLYRTYGNWLLGAHIGYLRAETEQDASAEGAGGVLEAIAARDLDLGQYRIGFDIAYDYKSFLEPFFGLDFVNNSTFERVVLPTGLAQPANDNDEYEMLAGFRYFGDYFDGVLQFRKNFDKDDINTGSIEAVVVMDF